MDIDDFAGTTPEFLPEAFLAGALDGWGVLERLTGGLRKRFVVKARGTWDASAGRLAFAEAWTFDDGRVDTLVLTITKRGGGHYVGTETRVSGEAHGERAGCAFRWRYSRDTPLGGGKSPTLDFNDWLSDRARRRDRQGRRGPARHSLYRGARHLSQALRRGRIAVLPPRSRPAIVGFSAPC